MDLVSSDFKSKVAEKKQLHLTTEAMTRGK